MYLLRIFDNQLFPTKCKISELINIYEFANFYSVKNPEVLDALKKLNSKIFIKWHTKLNSYLLNTLYVTIIEWLTKFNKSKPVAFTLQNHYFWIYFICWKAKISPGGEKYPTLKTTAQNECGKWRHFYSSSVQPLYSIKHQKCQ